MYSLQVFPSVRPPADVLAIGVYQAEMPAPWLRGVVWHVYGQSPHVSFRRFFDHFLRRTVAGWGVFISVNSPVRHSHFFKNLTDVFGGHVEKLLSMSLIMAGSSYRDADQSRPRRGKIRKAEIQHEYG